MRLIVSTNLNVFCSRDILQTSFTNAEPRFTQLTLIVKVVVTRQRVTSLHADIGEMHRSDKHYFYRLVTDGSTVY